MGVWAAAREHKKLRKLCFGGRAFCELTFCCSFVALLWRLLYCSNSGPISSFQRKALCKTGKVFFLLHTRADRLPKKGFLCFK